MADLIYSADDLTPGEPNNVNEVKAIKTETAAYVNGSGWVNSARLAAGSVSTAKIADDAVTGAKLDATAVGDSDQGGELGVNGASTVRRGKSIIATEESTTSTSYTYLTTPDRVQNVVLPTDGLIFVAFEANWRSSVAAAGEAAIFVGANQINVQHDESPTGSPVGTQSALTVGGVGDDQSLVSCPIGVVGVGRSSYSRGANVATGQVIGAALRDDSSRIAYRAGSSGGRQVVGPGFVGGPCAIFAAAGTYDIGIKFKASSGTVYAKERKLWVWTMGF